MIADCETHSYSGCLHTAVGGKTEVAAEPEVAELEAAGPEVAGPEVAELEAVVPEVD